MKSLSLAAQKRDLVGKRVKKLRREGQLPISVYGKGFTSQSLQVPYKDFQKVYRTVGKTGLVDVKVGAQSYPALIRTVQIHPVSGVPLHAEFHKVKLTDKITANIPLELVGESPAARDGIGLLLQTLNEVSVEALPTELPEKIAVDVSRLVALGDQIAVSDLAKPTSGEIKTDGGNIIVKVVPVVSEEAKKEAEALVASQAAEQTAIPPAPAPNGEAQPEVSSSPKTDETKAQ